MPLSQCTMGHMKTYMSSVDSTESREKKKKKKKKNKAKKNPAAKCYPQWEVNPGPLILLPCMLLSELILLFALSLNPLDPYVVMLY